MVPAYWSMTSENCSIEYVDGDGSVAPPRPVVVGVSRPRRVFVSVSPTPDETGSTSEILG